MPITSQYNQLKRQTLQSFVDFSKGESLPQWPIELFLEISNICDLKCAMCPTFSALNHNRLANLKRNERGLISMDQGVKKLDSLLKQALRVHAFGYGEPTLHPQFREVIETLSEYEVMVDFFTHGMHFTEEVCQSLVDSGVVRLTISFSGATKEDYENVYLGGNFEQVLSGIKRLADCKSRNGKSFPEIEINSLGFHHHIDTLPQFVQLMGDHGVNTIHLKPLHNYKFIKELRGHKSFMHPSKEGEKVKQAQEIATRLGVNLASKPYELSQTAAVGFEKAMQKMSPSELDAVNLKKIDELLPISELKVIASSDDKKQAAKQKLSEFEQEAVENIHEIKTEGWLQHEGTPCLEPFKTFYTNLDGKVYTCCFRNSKNYIGHLDNNSGEEIWNGATHNKIKQEAIHNRYLTEMCKGCIRKNSYPRNHGIQQTFNLYSRWYKERFSEEFFPDFQATINQLPNNETILKNHLKN